MHSIETIEEGRWEAAEVNTRFTEGGSLVKVTMKLAHKTNKHRKSQARVVVKSDALSNFWQPERVDSNKMVYVWIRCGMG
jgi:hypothetical protein